MIRTLVQASLMVATIVILSVVIYGLAGCSNSEMGPTLGEENSQFAERMDKFPIVAGKSDGLEESEDGEVRIVAEQVGTTVVSKIQYRNLSAFWLDGFDHPEGWPGIPDKLLPIISFAAGGADVSISPARYFTGTPEATFPYVESLDIETIFTGSNPLAEEQLIRVGIFGWNTPEGADCNAFWDPTSGVIPGCPIPFPENEWVTMFQITHHLHDGVRGEAEIRVFSGIDDLALPETSTTIVVKTRKKISTFVR